MSMFQLRYKGIYHEMLNDWDGTSDNLHVVVNSHGQWTDRMCHVDFFNTGVENYQILYSEQEKKAVVYR